jgi:hypothetical protein
MILTVFKLFIEFSELANEVNSKVSSKGYLYRWKNTELLMWETINLWNSPLNHYQSVWPMLLEQLQL